GRRAGEAGGVGARLSLERRLGRSRLRRGPASPAALVARAALPAARRGHARLRSGAGPRVSSGARALGGEGGGDGGRDLGPAGIAAVHHRVPRRHAEPSRRQSPPRGAAPPRRHGVLGDRLVQLRRGCGGGGHAPEVSSTRRVTLILLPGLDGPTSSSTRCSRPRRRGSKRIVSNIPSPGRMTIAIYYRSCATHAKPAKSFSCWGGPFQVRLRSCWRRSPPQRFAASSSAPRSSRRRGPSFV